MVISASEGSSLVSVTQGAVTTGIGQEVLLVMANQNSQGYLTKGYNPPASGKLTFQEAQDWRNRKEKDLKPKIQKVLDQLKELQKQEHHAHKHYHCY